VARFVAGAIFGAALMLVGGAALGIHARDPETDIQSAAAAAHVDPTDLQGALNSLKSAGVADTDPYVYLRATGELSGAPAESARAPAKANSVANSASPAAFVSGVWSALAQCESSGDPRTNTGNGYYGLYQEDMSFWRTHGGLAFAPRPDLATPAQQLMVAERGLAVQGPAAWPRCSRVVGLR
jgi:transglycosylase-like protein